MIFEQKSSIPLLVLINNSVSRLSKTTSEITFPSFSMFEVIPLFYYLKQIFERNWDAETTSCAEIEACFLNIAACIVSARAEGGLTCNLTRCA